MKTASADAGFSCAEAFREGKASTSVGISQEEAFRVGEALSQTASAHRHFNNLKNVFDDNVSFVFASVYTDLCD